MKVLLVLCFYTTFVVFTVCSDEAYCSDEEHSCHSNGRVPPCFPQDTKCDGIPYCSNCFDEADCPNSGLFFFCNDAKTCVPFHPYFCDGHQHCDDNSDEKKIGFGFKCAPYNKNPSASKCVVPQQYLERSLQEQRITICENDADKCFAIKNGTKIFDPTMCWTCLDGTIIQRLQVCDGVFDCPDLSDECLCFQNKVADVCAAVSQNGCDSDEISCPNEQKCFKVENICDKENNCLGGIDKYCVSNSCEGEDNAANEISCSSGAFVNGFKKAFKCNGVIECRHAEDECRSDCPEQSYYCNHTNGGNEIIKFRDVSNCTVSVSDLCNKVDDCGDGIDEKYCPPLQLCDANNPDSGYYDNTPCGPDRCNLEAVCNNSADELNCSDDTHFYCDGGRTFVPQWRRYDGIFDCKDATDECNILSTSVSSPTELIELIPLRVCLWIFMLLSLIGNGIVICKTMLDLSNAVHRRLHCSINRVGVCNKIMILNLAISDFLMGIYLFIIAVKSVEFSGRYCEEQKDWLMNSECSLAGILAVISSEASVFLMVLMTSYRLYGVANPFRADKLRCKIIYFATGIIWILSLLLAVIPVLPSLQANFASAIFLNQPYGSNLLSMSDMSKLINTARELPGLNKSIPEATDLSVSTFCNLFVNQTSLPSYCDDPDSVANSIVGYYGSDGVCLPRYYSDANELASRYSLGIVSLNFVAFLYMFFAYFYIYRSTSLGTVQQGEAHGSSIDENRSKENQALWGKIVRLIVTDFICWIPVSVMSFVSFAGVVIPDMAYPITAILLIPINSAANPWLYSSFLIGYIRRFLRYFRKLSNKKKRRTSGQTGKTGERLGRNGNTIASYNRRISKIELMPSTPSSGEHTANEIVTVATEL